MVTLRTERGGSAGPAAQICFPQAVDGNRAVPECLLGGRAPEFTSLSRRHPQRRSMSSPGYPQRCPPGPVDHGHNRVLASPAGLPGSQAAVTPGKGAIGQQGNRRLRPPGSPRGTHLSSAIISLCRGSPPAFAPAVPAVPAAVVPVAATVVPVGLRPEAGPPFPASRRHSAHGHPRRCGAPECHSAG